ncbi:uncharacterized protein LOC111889764 [Lactuca sativa]|uniref:DUF7894 domain-containing protein n=2 Tax=Lactuca TaxID=4235 RepID=A0AA36A5J0_LACSI|nr:uncharacterized protein LOC111889764 [Lactuca sativa]KAJ0186840.1 hypothetical protein LSAT_V11C900497500 [Lactuca sativa]CAI9303917.1 unnamed protein product [Lactuca saligna]
MKTAPQVILIFDKALATAITGGLQPNANSPLQISTESFDLSLARYGITGVRASGNITHFVDRNRVPQVSILVMQKYESPVLACAISEVLSSLAGEDKSNMPSLILPFILDSSKIKLERKNSPDESVYGIQIGPQTDMMQTLATRHEKAPSSMQIHHEQLSCVLQLVRVLKTPAFILIGQIGQHKSTTNDLEVICKIGETLASVSSLQFVKENITWNPNKVSKEHEKEPWRALYG